MVTSRAVVGSSCDQQLRLTGHGHCDHYTLAHTAGKLDGDSSSESYPAQEYLRDFSTSYALWMSLFFRKIIMKQNCLCKLLLYFIHGFREFIGSWKIMATSRPLIFLMPFLSSLRRSLPLSRISPLEILLLPCQKFHNGREVTDLPHPDSPTRPRISPG